MSQVSCPSAKVLQEYVLGMCDDDTSEEIEQHLAACAPCEDTITGFDSAQDTLTRHLPLVAAADRDKPEPAWLDKLRHAAPLSPGQPSPAANECPLSPPAEGLNNYEVLGVLGQGGMGLVCLARHRQLDRQVALKILHPRTSLAAKAQRRFQQEIRLLGSLNHPGIVMATDAGATASGAYLVMELVDGTSLAGLVRHRGPFTHQEACETGRQLAEALSAAHQLDVIHRDVKPSNVMIERATGRVRLLDFGLARYASLSLNSGETSVGQLVGTLDYIAPEQCGEQQMIDSRADLYGLGATLFFLLTGQPPHGDRTERTLVQQVHRVCHETPPRVSSIRTGVPEELDDLVARLLSLDPSDRPDSAADVAGSLSEWAGDDLTDQVVAHPAAQLAVDRSPLAMEEAQHSLAAVLQAQEGSSSAQGRHSGRTSWLIGLAAAGLMLAAVVLQLPTPEGTLTIESEVNDIRVNLVDGNNQSQELSIDRGSNDTTLGTGRYQIRLASPHDGISLDRNVVILRRNESTVARITRTVPQSSSAAERPFVFDVAESEQPLESPVTTANSAAPLHRTDVGGEQPAALRTSGSEPMFQGQPRSEWQQVFSGEADPISKLKAAQALLGMVLCSPKQGRNANRMAVEQILDIGEEIVRAGFGENVLNSAFESRTTPPLGARHWQLSRESLLSPGEDAYKAYSEYQRILNHQLHRVPGDILADHLSQAMVNGSDARAALAYSLLPIVIHARFEADGDRDHHVDEMLQRLDLPLTGVDRSALFLMGRLVLASQATPEQFRTIDASLVRLATTLLQTPAEDTSFAAALRDHLLVTARLHADHQHSLVHPVHTNRVGNPGHRLSPELRLALARLLLDSAQQNHLRFQTHVPLGLGVPGSQPPYASGYVTVVRDQMAIVFDTWPIVANEHLRAHQTPPPGGGSRNVLQVLDLVTCAARDEDNLPLDETAELLTAQLQSVYANEPGVVCGETVPAVLPATPAQLLAIVVRITGDLPEFVHAGHCCVASVQQQLHELDTILDGSGSNASSLNGLLAAAPYATLHRIAKADNIDRTGVLSELSGSFREVTHVVDPLLLLSILTQLTGEDGAIDEWIESLIQAGPSSTTIREHIKTLLQSDLLAGRHAKHLLSRMAEKARGEKLVHTIHSLDPALENTATAGVETE